MKNYGHTPAKRVKTDAAAKWGKAARDWTSNAVCNAAKQTALKEPTKTIFPTSAPDDTVKDEEHTAAFPIGPHATLMICVVYQDLSGGWHQTKNFYELILTPGQIPRVDFALSDTDAN